MRRFVIPLACLGGAALLAGAAPKDPVALMGIQPGLWEVSEFANGANPKRVCFQDVIQLSEIVHGDKSCEHTILRDAPDRVTMDLTCGPGNFGRSIIVVTTPRSLKLESQGIYQSEPFRQTLYARRVGDCPPVRRQR